MANHGEKLIQDIKLVLVDLENIATEAKDKTSQEISDMQDQLTDEVKLLKGKLIAAEQDFLMKEQIAAEMASTYIHKNAWKLIVVAAVVGFFFGYTIK